MTSWLSNIKWFFKKITFTADFPAFLSRAQKISASKISVEVTIPQAERAGWDDNAFIWPMTMILLYKAYKNDKVCATWKHTEIYDFTKNRQLDGALMYDCVCNIINRFADTLTMLQSHSISPEINPDVFEMFNRCFRIKRGSSDARHLINAISRSRLAASKFITIPL